MYRSAIASGPSDQDDSRRARVVRMVQDANQPVSRALKLDESLLRIHAPRFLKIPATSSASASYSPALPRVWTQYGFTSTCDRVTPTPAFRQAATVSCTAT